MALQSFVASPSVLQCTFPKYMVLTNGSQYWPAAQLQYHFLQSKWREKDPWSSSFSVFFSSLAESLCGAVCLQGAASLSSICRHSEWPHFRSCLVLFSSSMFFFAESVRYEREDFRSKCFHQTEFSSSLWPKSQSAISIPFLKGQVCSTAINCQCFLSVCVLDVRTQLFIAKYCKADPPEPVQFAAWIPSPQVSQHRWLLTLVLVLVLPPLQGSVWHLAKGPRGRAWQGTTRHFPAPH